MLQAKKETDENTKAFRNSFVLGYAQAIQARLRKATEEVAKTDNSMALVLVDNKKAIDEMVEETFTLRSGPGYSRSSAAGYTSGAEAGRRASIDGNNLGTRKGIGG